MSYLTDKTEKAIQELQTIISVHEDNDEVLKHHLRGWLWGFERLTREQMIDRARNMANLLSMNLKDLNNQTAYPEAESSEGISDDV